MRLFLYMTAVACAMCVYQSRAEVITLSNGDDLSATIDPQTLKTTLIRDGQSFVICESIDNIDLVKVLDTTGGNRFDAVYNEHVNVSVLLNDDGVQVAIMMEQPGSFAWPVLRGDAVGNAMILPLFEGSFVPTDDPDWAAFLAHESPMNTTSGLMMPFFGVQHENHTVTYLIGNEFNNEVEFSHDEGEPEKTAMRLAHRFPPNNVHAAHGLMIRIGDASPVEPARQYRKWLMDRGQFVPMRQKIKNTHRAERLLGAPHIYLWGEDVFCHVDVKQWKPFAQVLRDGGELDDDLSPAKRLWETLNDEARGAVNEVLTEQWPSKYAKSVIVMQIGEALRTKVIVEVIDDEMSQFNANRAWFIRTFGRFMTEPHTWGDGISTKMIDALHDAGIDRALLLTSGPTSAAEKPQVAAHAEEVGYLFGPYDSYHSMHHPDTPADTTWETAQFDLKLYETGGIVSENGEFLRGFKQRGRLLSPLAAQPYVESRVDGIMARAPMSAWFIDCDAFGDVFDDYATEHPSTQRQDAEARNARMAWIRNSHEVVIGSEGGSAYAAGTIHFAHGMMTPVIGWGDDDLKQRDSKYYLGGWWPPNGPRVFTQQVPLKPKYKKLFYDPRYRLPLYQVVFHDSVIATHQWGYHSLKFGDQVNTVALLEQLYNVPPVYHLNLVEWQKHRGHITKHDAFFKPLHRELALQAMTDFHWLTDDKLVQQTTFANGAVIVANFSDDPYIHEVEGEQAVTISPGSVLARRPDQVAKRYSP